MPMPLDAAARAQGLHRVVEVRAGGRTSTGYAVTPDLVLTAAHALPDEGGGVRVRTVDGRAADAEIVWEGPAGVDAALLRVADAPWAEDPAVRYTRWGSPGGDDVPVVARGFPRAAKIGDVRDVETMRGTVDYGTGVRHGRYGVNVRTPRLDTSDEPLWRGMSGAALLAEPGGQVLGVTVYDQSAFQGTRLLVVPAAVLVRDPEFAELTGAGRDHDETVVRRDVPTVDRLLVPPVEPLPERASDWQLLLSKYAVVPFCGRDEVLDELRAWCAGPARFDVAVITGDGGAGKTRLAGHLCGEMTAAGWDAGILAESALQDAYGAAPYPEITRPVLLVVDYPEPLAAGVAALIRAMMTRRHGAPVRLLLVARANAAADGLRDAPWWTEVTGLAEGYAAEPPVVALNVHHLTDAERAEHWTAAVTAFGGVDAEPVPLTGEEFAHPLRVHIAALLASRGESVERGVLRQFLARETRVWTRSLPAGFDPVLARQAVALVALTTPERDGLRECLALLPDADPAARRVLARWLPTVFPGDGDRLVFGPDRLTEELLGSTEDLPLLVAGMYERNGTGVLDAFDALILAADRPNVRRALGGMLSGHLPELAEAALAGNGPEASALETVLRLLADETEIRVDGLRYDTGPFWAHWSLRGALAMLVAIRMRHYKEPGLLGTLTDLAAYQLAFSRTAEAFDTTAEAVGLLAEQPEVTEAQARLYSAMAVIDTTNGFGDNAVLQIDRAVELHGAALEHVTGDELARLLSHADGDLVNSAIIHANAGDYAGAARALSQAVGGEDPYGLTAALVAVTELAPTGDPAGFGHHSCFFHVGHSGRLDYRSDVTAWGVRLAAHVPDSAEPGWAAAMHRLAVAVHAASGAADAVRVAERVATSSPEAAEFLIRVLVEAQDHAGVVAVIDRLRAFTGDLPERRAYFLASEGIADYYVGQYAEAVEVLTRAAEAHRALGPSMSMVETLRHLAWALHACDDHTAELRVAEELTGVLRGLAERHPHLRADLLNALRNLAELRGLLDMEIADVLDEALLMRSRLGESFGEDAFDLDLLSAGYHAFRDPLASLALTEDVAARARARMNAVYPPEPARVAEYLTALQSQLVAKLTTGRARDAVALVVQGFELVERHLDDHPSRAHLAVSLKSQYGRALTMLGERERAVEVLEKAAAELEEAPPAFWTDTNIVAVHSTLGLVYGQIGEHARAVECLDRAVASLRALPESASRSLKLGECLQLQASLAAMTGRRDDTEAMLDEADALLMGLGGIAGVLLGFSLQTRAWLRFVDDDLDGAIEAIFASLRLTEPYADDGPEPGIHASIQEYGAYLLAIAGREEEAAALAVTGTDKIESLLERGVALSPRLYGRHVMGCLVRVLAAADDADAEAVAHWSERAFHALRCGPRADLPPLLDLILGAFGEQLPEDAEAPLERLLVEEARILLAEAGDILPADVVELFRLMTEGGDPDEVAAAFDRHLDIAEDRTF
ncbi:hypothetical protein Afil01_53920 [Actinorhabdospora filicis]|uniref:Tetratricopeptide repeat protein n=1 Tax=Actinorhabdospora filicis TaxID=1785913 RepID=A0A9W6WD90_9ACTN|nr:serine protease [Actinorhabdospora filicis]GLZ80585.1 hypothetical protein Afil01_53920 [Actinorhabdospora filicis]